MKAGGRGLHSVSDSAITQPPSRVTGPSFHLFYLPGAREAAAATGRQKGVRKAKKREGLGEGKPAIQAF